MDIVRPPKPKRAPWTPIAVVLTLVALTVAFSRLRAAPTVGIARRSGSSTREARAMLRQVRGGGTWFPSEIRCVSASSGGRVERDCSFDAARSIEPDGELLELANPDVQLEALDADRQRLG